MAIEFTEKDELMMYISDAHKDAYGFRPYSGFNLTEMSLDELRATADKMSDRVAQSNIEDREREAEAVTLFDAKVEELIAMGAKTFNKAIEWMLEAEGDYQHQIGALEYTWGVPYGYIEKKLGGEA